MTINKTFRYTISLRLILSFLCVILVQTISAIQSVTASVSGQVLNSGKQAFENAATSIEGTSIGTYTDEKGHYTLKNVPVGNQILVVSGVGIQETRLNILVETGKENNQKDIIIHENKELSEVTITGKTIAGKQQEQAYDISVVDARKSYNTSAGLGDLINKSSGVRIREAGGLGSDYSFTLNGFSGKQVKIFLDGIPMDNFGTSLGLNSLSTSGIDRVEIYKGVLPVNLGADALGGAVNIVSRKDANYLDLSYGIGSFNTHQAAMNGAWSNPKTGLSLRINTFYNYSDNNYRVYVPILNLETNKKGPSQWVRRFHDAYQSNGIKLEAGVTGKSYADYLTAGLILSGNKNDIQNGVTMETVFGAKKVAGETFLPSIKYKKTDLFANGLDLTFYGAYNMTDQQYTDTVARRYNWLGDWISKESRSAGETVRSQLTNKNREWLSNVNLVYRLNAHHLISFNHVSSDLDRKTNDLEDPDNAFYKIPQSLHKTTSGIGWTSQYNKWNLNLFGKRYRMKGNSYEYANQFTDSSRLEKITTSHTKYGYGLAATGFLIPGIQVKTSYEHTYRLPEGSEMFGDGLFNVRNSSLKPERSDNFNVGLLLQASLSDQQVLYSEVNFLFRDSKDFIQKELKDPSTQYINLGNVLTKGIEGSLKYKWNNILHAGVTMTYQNIIDHAPYVITTGYVGAGKIKNLTYKDRLPNIPYLFGNADFGTSFRNFLFKSTDLSLDYGLSYVESYYLSWPSLGSSRTKSIIPEQLSHNLSIGYTLKNGTYNLFAECTNFTDQKIYDNYMLQKPGRSFMLKFRYFIHR